MRDRNKTKGQLIEELTDLRQRIAELEVADTARVQAEEALRKERNFAESLVNTAQTIILVLDVAGRIVRFNPYMETLSGYSLAEVQGQDWFSTFLPTQDHSKIRDLFQEAVKDTHTRGNVNLIVTRDGRERQIEWNDETLKDAAGNVVGLLTIGQDITERVQAEEALRESEERYRAVIQAQTALIYRYLPDGTITFANDAYCQFYGRPLDEIVGTNQFDMIPAETQNTVRKHIASLNAENPVATNENRNTNIHGESRWFHWTDQVILNADGDIVEYQAVGHDITERVQAEEALRESEERFRAIFETAQDSIFIKDRTLKYTLVNPAMERLFGLPVSKLIGLTDGDLFPEETASHIRAGDSRVLGGEIIKEEHTKPVKEVPHTFHIIKVPMCDSSGEIIGLCGTARDITARARAAAALRESHAKLNRLNSMLRLMCDNLPESIWAKDLQGRFMFVNKSCCEDLLNARDVYEPVGKTDLFFAERESQSHPENPNYHTFGETCTDSDGAVLETRKVIRGDESGYLKGKFVIFDVIKSPFWDENGELVGTVGCARDVTRERETENERQQVKAEREQLLSQIQIQAHLMRGIMDTVPEGVLLLDTAQRVILANPVAEGDLAVLAAAQVGDIITRLGDRPLVELLTSPPTKGVWHEVKTDGRTFAVIARPMANGPEPENWVLVIRDVTQEREIEWRTQQQERLAAVGQLAAGIAHDFNNIMAVIILYTQMSLNTPGLPAKISQHLETISGQAYRATDLVQQILDFSRRAVLERCPMDLTPFLKETVKLLKRTVPENIKIDFTYGADEYTVHADPTRLQQALMNLAVNARDAMPEGGELRIELARIQVKNSKKSPLPEMEAGEWVRMRVTDTGDGIPPEVLPHIFEPFFTTKEVDQGTGLGLAQVYGIVKQHEGHVDVSTEVGAGTTFTLYLPALLSSLPEAPAQATETLVQGQGETILVVEDNAALRQALAATLEALNYLVLEAADGREALGILEQRAGEVSLVLSDLVMPEMGGQALFHAMQQRGLNLPVVMLSGHPLESELEALQAQGLAGWLLKPPDLDQLAQLLAQALSKDAE
ncbi:MAG: PAS domain S-box protein [Anaerolineae bacterium]|nr:PAS domain S-box protein [Anaerolineae bacterium]